MRCCDGFHDAVQDGTVGTDRQARRNRLHSSRHPASRTAASWRRAVMSKPYATRPRPCAMEPSRSAGAPNIHPPARAAFDAAGASPLPNCGGKAQTQRWVPFLGATC